MKNIKNISRRLFVRTTGVATAGFTLLPDSYIMGKISQGEGNLTITQGKVKIQTPNFVFNLDTNDGLRAVSWENRLTGNMLALGNGSEVGFDIGLPDGQLVTPKLRVKSMPTETKSVAGEAVFKLESSDPAAEVRVIYKWDASQPVLHKFVTIENQSTNIWERLLNVRLGSYDTDGTRIIDKFSGGTYSVPAPRNFPIEESTHVERGFPIYIEDEFFLSLAHPAGAAEGATGKILLSQYPGIILSPGKPFNCMELVYGVSRAGMARQAFISHLQSRMRRITNGHDRVYTVFDNFGSWPSGNFMNEEAYVMWSLRLLEESQKAAGVHFDLYSVDFWVDYHGTLKECDPERFPNGLTPIKQALDDLGTDLGLWIDGSVESWSIGGNPNPEVQGCLNYDLDNPESRVQLRRRAFCRATEPIKSMYTDAFVHHIRHNGARLLKFDNTNCICVNPAHDHLPGLYSTEPIENSLIEFFRALDSACPDVFLMLYWGYKSPWWLLHADTLFDSGLNMEAASPSDQPAVYMRDSVTQKLDQGQRFAKDIPALGKDSLGVWLSDWGWNSQIGKERWQEAFIMDICRGSLLGQIWSDYNWLSPSEWEQLADFLGLLKARPGCFGNPVFILGDPLKNETYGYSCSNGERGFLAINNATWEDRTVNFQLNNKWGLPDNKNWDLYRWYPDPVRLTGDKDYFNENAIMAMRPFDVVLLEAVPRGESPSLSRRFTQEKIRTGFIEPSRRIEINVSGKDEYPGSWIIKGEIPATTKGGYFVVAVKLIDNEGHPVELRNLGSFFDAKATVGGSPEEIQPALGDQTYPSCWQSWRIKVGANGQSSPFILKIDDTCKSGGLRLFSAYLLLMN